MVSKLLKTLLALNLAAGALYAVSASAAEPSAAPAKAKQAKPVAERVIKLSVTENGYEPSPLKLVKGEPVKLLITRKTDKTCATDIVMPAHNIKTALPLNQEVAVSFTPDKAGTLTYGCAMGQMIAGQFQVE